MEMGFDSKTSARALRRTNFDFNKALDMLNAGTVPDEDEFDMMADEPAQIPVHAAPTVPKPSAPKPDTFRKGMPAGAGDASAVDSRVQQLVEMGFSEKDSEVCVCGACAQTCGRSYMPLLSNRMRVFADLYMCC